MKLFRQIGDVRAEDGSAAVYSQLLESHLIQRECSGLVHA